MWRLFAVVVVTLALAGCATFPGFAQWQAARSPAVVGSGETVKLNPAQESLIAKDMVSVLKKNGFGPGQSVFIVSGSGPIGDALRDALRNGGYGVSGGGPAVAGTGLTYLVDIYLPGSIVVGVGADAFYAMRLYDVMPLGNVEGQGDWTVREASK